MKRLPLYLELTKPRIAMLALIMAALGYFWGTPPEAMSISTLMWLMIGLSLVGASSGALNQYLEMDVDAKMHRTLERPLPSRKLEPKHALMFGWLCGLLGELVLLIAINPLTAILGAVTLLFYLGIYTPSKAIAPASTLLGAVPGALPPLMGWTAATGSLGWEGILLFSILFIWQIPHFLAIALIYREDYSRAGLPILSVVDTDGAMLVKQILVYSVVLLPVTLVPSVWGRAGNSYFWGAMGLGAVFIALGMVLSVVRSLRWARALFLFSILYLPALGVLLVWDRVV